MEFGFIAWALVSIHKTLVSHIPAYVRLNYSSFILISCISCFYECL